jgi:hypothetical protein
MPFVKIALENLYLLRVPNHSTIIKYIGNFEIQTKAEVAYPKKTTHHGNKHSENRPRHA